MRFGNPSKKTKVVTSLKGHAIEFPGKGSEPPEFPAEIAKKFPDRVPVVSEGVIYVYVPTAMHSEVQSQGLMPETEIEERDEPVGPKKPQDPEDLQKEVFDTFTTLVELGERNSFAGNGMPAMPALKELLGYDLTKAELKDLWGKFQQAQKE